MFRSFNGIKYQNQPVGFRAKPTHKFALCDDASAIHNVHKAVKFVAINFTIRVE